jgi:hypothetical protein
VSPNSFVIGFDPDDDIVLVHQLRPDPDALRRLVRRS